MHKFIKDSAPSFTGKLRVLAVLAILVAAAFSGSVDVIFKSGYRDYVSRRCFADIKKELK